MGSLLLRFHQLPPALGRDARTCKSALVGEQASPSSRSSRSSEGRRWSRRGAGVTAPPSPSAPSPSPSPASPLSSARLRDGFPRLREALPQLTEGCERGGVPERFRAGEVVREGVLSCGRMAMAAGLFVGLGLVLQQGGGVDVSAQAMGAEGLQLVAAFPWEREQVGEQLEPSKGTCATCIGVVDETLGACNATANCVSSFDDRPKFFLAPWEFPGKLPVAVEKLREVLLSSGAQIEEQEERYVHAVFTSKEGVVDDVEFLFSDPSEDAIVVLRSASRAINSDDSQRNRKRLEEIRKSLSWEQVPVLRNRKRTFFFLESPWDTFGPEPPPLIDYRDDLEVGHE